jgi:hypothetical protein
VTPIDEQEHARSCDSLVTAIAARSFRHLGDPRINEALKGAATRPLGESWAWARKPSSADICPLVAFTLARRKVELLGDGDALVTFSPDELAEVWGWMIDETA